MEAVAPYERVKRLSIPILLVHGGSDRFIPLTNLRLLHQRAPKQWAQRQVLRGRKHSDVLLDSNYAQRVVDFLDDTFATESITHPAPTASTIRQAALP